MIVIKRKGGPKSPLRCHFLGDEKLAEEWEFPGKWSLRNVDARRRDVRGDSPLITLEAASRLDDVPGTVRRTEQSNVCLAVAIPVTVHRSVACTAPLNTGQTQ